MTEEVFLGKCTDGRIHGFQCLDDGAVRPTPLCGASVRSVERGDDEEVCPECIPLIEVELGLQPGDLENDDE